jgi:hypothetical protein
LAVHGVVAFTLEKRLEDASLGRKRILVL